VYTVYLFSIKTKSKDNRMVINSHR